MARLAESEVALAWNTEAAEDLHTRGDGQRTRLDVLCGRRSSCKGTRVGTEADGFMNAFIVEVFGLDAG